MGCRSNHAGSKKQISGGHARRLLSVSLFLFSFKPLPPTDPSTLTLLYIPFSCFQMVRRNTDRRASPSPPPSSLSLSSSRSPSSRSLPSSSLPAHPFPTNRRHLQTIPQSSSTPSRRPTPKNRTPRTRRSNHPLAFSPPSSSSTNPLRLPTILIPTRARTTQGSVRRTYHREGGSTVVCEGEGD